MTPFSTAENLENSSFGEAIESGANLFDITVGAACQPLGGVKSPGVGLEEESHIQAYEILGVFGDELSHTRVHDSFLPTPIGYHSAQLGRACNRVSAHKYSPPSGSFPAEALLFLCGWA
jgi:hypothetical protein